MKKKKKPVDPRYAELRAEVSRLRKELRSRKASDKKLRRAVRDREDAIRQCGTEIVLLRKEKERLRLETDRLIQTLQNRDRAEARAIEQVCLLRMQQSSASALRITTVLLVLKAARNPDNTSHKEALQLAVMAQVPCTT